METFLDKNANKCFQPEATLVSTTETLPGTGIQHSKKQTLKAYNPQTGETAESLSQTQNTNPIGLPEEIELTRYQFSPQPGNILICQRPNCSISIHPTTDKTDVESFLKSFHSIEEKLLNRSLATRETLTISTQKTTRSKKNL